MEGIVEALSLTAMRENILSPSVLIDALFLEELMGSYTKKMLLRLAGIHSSIKIRRMLP